MVTRSDDQIRPYLAAVPAQHARAQRPTGRRSRRYAATEPGRVQPQGARMGREARGRAQEGDCRGKRRSHGRVDQEEEYPGQGERGESETGSVRSHDITG
jgi:hypothetical protein